jgi:hypothetical protein
VDNKLRDPAEIFGISDISCSRWRIEYRHTGFDKAKEILPTWDPGRDSLALDVGKIISSDPDVVRLIQTDIERFYHPAQVARPHDILVPHGISESPNVSPARAVLVLGSLLSRPTSPKRHIPVA